MKITLFSKSKMFLSIGLLSIIGLNWMLSNLLCDDTFHILFFCLFVIVQFKSTIEFASTMSDQLIVFDFRTDYQKEEAEDRRQRDLFIGLNNRLLVEIAEGQISKEEAQSRIKQVIEFSLEKHNLLLLEPQKEFV